MTGYFHSAEYEFIHGDGARRPLGFMDTGKLVARGRSFFNGSRNSLKRLLLSTTTLKDPLT